MAQKVSGFSLPCGVPDTDLQLMLDYIQKSSMAEDADGRATEDKLLTSLAIHLRQRHRAS